MKKIVALILAVLTAFSLCACGDKGDGSTLMFDYKDLSKYIELGEYKGLKLDAKDAELLKLVDQFNTDALEGAGLGDEAEIVSGTVQNGDTVHITYVGKMNGEAFSGGSTGDEGTDLVIGSGSYIDGFESGLIGAKPGSTVVLNLNFPDPYQNNPDLAGKPVEFTVNIQKITRTTYPEVTADIAKQLGYNSVDEYNNGLFEDAAKSLLFTAVSKESKVLEIPEAELKYYVESDVQYYTDYMVSMGGTLEQYLTSYGMTEKEFRAQLEENYKQNMASYMLVYYIARLEGLTAKASDINNKYKELAATYSVEVSEVKAQMDEKQIEYTIIYENVRDFLYKNAEITK